MSVDDVNKALTSKRDEITISKPRWRQKGYNKASFWRRKFHLKKSRKIIMSRDQNMTHQSPWRHLLLLTALFTSLFTFIVVHSISTTITQRLNNLWFTDVCIMGNVIDLILVWRIFNKLYLLTFFNRDKCCQNAPEIPYVFIYLFFFKPKLSLTIIKQKTQRDIQKMFWIFQFPPVGRLKRYRNYHPKAIFHSNTKRSLPHTVRRHNSS